MKSHSYANERKGDLKFFYNGKIIRRFVTFSLFSQKSLQQLKAPEENNTMYFGGQNSRTQLYLDVLLHAKD